jgi:hypothetical protein
MKSEKIILQCVRDELDEFDLALRREPNVFFFNLLPRNTGLHHQRRDVDPCRFGTFAGESRQRAFGLRARSDLMEYGITHQISIQMMANEKLTTTHPDCASIHWWQPVPL